VEFFFFQAEDGIRDRNVTGVQTCALPISQQDSGAADVPSRTGLRDGVDIMQFHETAVGGESDNIAPDPGDPDTIYGGRVSKLDRSEERRVGKEWGERWGREA